MIETSYTAEQPAEPIDYSSPDDLPAETPHQFAETVEYDGPIADSALEIESFNVPAPSEPARSYEPPLSTGSLMTAPTEEFRHDGRDPFASTADDFELDEIDLLDLSNADPKQHVNFATPTEARTQGSNQQVVSLSPELIEVIVQKVVEKLSEKY